MKKHMKITIGIVLLAAVATVWLAIRPKWNPVHSNPVIKSIKIDGKRVQVRLRRNEDLSDVVSLAWFQGLKPVNSFKSAKDKYGMPDNVRTNNNHFIAYEYWYQYGHVDITREETAKGVSWSLRAYPNCLFYVKVFAEEIVDAVGPKTEDCVVVIYGEDNDLSMIVTLQGIRVEEFFWPYRPALETDAIFELGKFIVPSGDSER